MGEITPSSTTTSTQASAQAGTAKHGSGPIATPGSGRPGERRRPAPVWRGIPLYQPVLDGWM